ncbi:MoaD/ThiS family protein [Nocardia sp. NPDC049220]|uniref:MoaD/ThiS family protein n=1 Tax=Nocardia sp. NPDC049220 TaxID=3155273 RepID=UPI0034101A5F
MVEIHYFAAMAEAVGRDREDLDLPAGATIADLCSTLATRYGADIAKRLAVCAFVVGDELTRDRGTPLSLRVDVLPPFAGG